MRRTRTASSLGRARLAQRYGGGFLVVLPVALLLAGAPAADGAEQQPPAASAPPSSVTYHEIDVPPPGMSVAVDVPPRALVTDATSKVACTGDGVSGSRVEVLYARAADVPDRYTAYLSSIRSWVAEADGFVNASAAETGGTRRLRFVHTAACAPVVRNVVLSPTGDDSFGNTITELQAAGFTASEHRYVTFVDANVLCGLSGNWGDDQPGSTNLNNHGTLYGRLDAGCWSAQTFMHELTHMLGGVQRSAPNSSGGGHCTDDNDLMCYTDAPLYPPMRIMCAAAVSQDRLDCNHDDYFSTAPPPGSYLATHWNVANSSFLSSGPPAVTALTPSSGPLTGSTPVTITGANFTGATKVTFNGVAGSAITVMSSTTLRVTAPVHAPGVVNVTVTTGDGKSASSSGAKYIYAGLPVVTGLRPASGPLAGGTVVTITGLNFTGASRVTFNGVAGTALTLVSASKVRVTTPARATAGTVDVQITAAGGQSITAITAKFTYRA